MNPKSISDSINKHLIEQMERTRPVGSHDKVLQQKLNDFFTQNPFVASPFVEKQAYYEQSENTTLGSLAGKPFTKGQKPVATQDDESEPPTYLQKATAQTFAAYFGKKAGDCKLYKHQAEAIEAVREGKNLLVCTGTGSGKTESFLIPVIDAIIREREAMGENYVSGVRAMILYPLNSLVNDQLLRIRKIFREAEKANIPHAKEVTFGIYTSELVEQEDAPDTVNDDISSELECISANDISPTAQHPYLSLEAVPRGEYTSRAQWLPQTPENPAGRGPADILITNYAMLERLLLDPAKKDVFSPTWRFIVLDEAHTYDGAQGTDISLLIRRVVNRVTEEEGKKEHKIQYIATSATLVDENAESAAQGQPIQPQGAAQTPRSMVKQVSARFAADLFNADADSFEILMGSVYTGDEAWSTDDKFPGHSYKALLEQAASAAFRQKAEEAGLPQCTRMGKTLVEQTRWLRDAKHWLENFNAFLPEKAHTQPATTGAPLPFGDAVALANTLALLPSHSGREHDSELPQLGFDEADATTRCLQLLIDEASEDKNETLPNIRRITGMELESQQAEVYASIRAFGSRGLAAQHFAVLAELLNQAYGASVDERLSKLACWKVRWNAQSEETICKARAKVQTLLQAVSELQVILNSAWNKLLEDVPGGDPTEKITNLLMSKRELNDLGKLLASPVAKDGAPAGLPSKERTISQLAAKLMLSEDEFVAFTQLLTLSRHPGLPGNRPLMDLRYHQVVRSLHSLVVCFDPHSRELIIPSPNHAEERWYQPEGDTEKLRQFNLGICYYCGAPFLLGYVNVNDRKAAVTLGQFPATGYRMHAYALCPENEETQAVCWLNPQEGTIHKKQPKQWAIPLYSDSAADGQYPNAVTCCPCCAEEATPQFKEGFGIIGPYAMGAGDARVTVLQTLVDGADAEYGVHQQKAEGRKVLAFSDSRAEAAEIAVAYDDISEQALVQTLLLATLQEMEETDTAETLRDLRNFGKGRNRKIGFGWIWDEDEQEDGPPEQKLAHSLHITLPRMTAGLKAAGATYLLNKEYQQAGLTCHFPEGSATALTTLRLLCTRGRRNHLLNGASPLLEVYSYALDNGVTKGNDPEYHKLWKKLLRIFHAAGATDEQAHAFFRSAYSYLFTIAKLECSSFDDQNGRDYESDESKSLEGYNVSYFFTRKSVIPKGRADNEHFSFCGQEGNGSLKMRQLLKEAAPAFRKSFGKNATAEEKKRVKDAIDALYRVMTYDNSILHKVHDKLYHFNLNDIRFTLTEAGKAEARKAKERLAGLTHYRVEEHTAQLNKQGGQLFQRLFSQGEINILSCSTTFEMGVDLGSLNCVFMTNMPPTVSNYRQRAGRAGRRSGSSAFVLTFLGKKGHDTYYRDHPEDLFFAPVQTPRIYVNNETFRSKHLRAVALHHFLSAICKPGSAFKWNLAEHFFLGRRMSDSSIPSCISQLADWVRTSEAEVQETCLDIIGKGSTLNYSVAYDLCLQLIGLQPLDNDKRSLSELQEGKLKEGTQPIIDARTYGQKLYPLNRENMGNFLKLSGAFLPDTNTAQGIENNYWQSSACYRFCRQARYASADNARYAREHLLRTQTTNVLSRMRILPSYGFPCDEVELMRHSDDHTPVELKRDLRMAIYEFAPGQTVKANKRAYTSRRAVWFIAPNTPVAAEARQHILLCRACGSYTIWPDAQVPEHCPHCKACNESQGLGDGNILESIQATQPDAFQAAPSRRATPGNKNKLHERICAYAGGKADSQGWVALAGNRPTRTKAYRSNSREILYLNILQNTIAVPGQDATFGALYHKINTDILLLSTDKSMEKLVPDWTLQRIAHAWQSVTQALLRAAAIVLGVSGEDIGGLSQTIANEHHIVLFDASANGSGAILRLLDSGNGETTHQKLLGNILTKALELCTGSCNCAEAEGKGELEPLILKKYHEEVQQNNTHVRLAQSCYKCLKSYSNQRQHELLDTHDAAVLLRYMLGDATEVEPLKAATQNMEDTTNDSHSTELPKATPAVTSEQKITSETKESLTELSDIEKPASLQLTAAQQALWDKMRDGLVSAGDKIEVWLQGVKKVMHYLGISESYIRCKQLGKNVERITPDQLIQLIH